MKYLAIILMTLAGCGLLQTREPEDPVGLSDSFNAAVTPQILFNNLVKSFQEKRIEYYLSCFVDSLALSVEYKFIPTANAFSKFAVFNDWDIEAEERYFRNLSNSINENSPITLTLFDEVQQSLGEIKEFQYNYTVVFSDKSGNQFLYQGLSRFRIALDSRQQWVIVEWEDSESDGNLSWSDIKGEYY